MRVRNLLDPIIDQGIRHTNFFEGRLLTAEDLRDQQGANRERARRLGRAIGKGIFEGLEVVLEDDGADGAVPVVTVRKGLALNGEGDVIGLPANDVQVALSRSLQATPTTEADFYACAGPPNTRQLPNGVGVYILVMSPAAGYKDRAPKSGLGDDGVVTGCGSRYVQEGVKFRLVEMVPTSLSGISEDTRTLLQEDLLSPGTPATRADSPRLSRLRNILAHLCFGTEVWSDVVADPFSVASRSLRYGALDELEELGDLSACDVPLALLYWTLDGVAFCDLWSVRRGVYEPSQSQDWPSLPAERARREGEARLRQFQEQVQDLIDSEAAPSIVSANDFFRYLPPAGLLPLVDAARPRGLTVPGFFGGRTYRDPVHIEGARFWPALSAAIAFPAIDLGQDTMTWVYLIRENRQSASPGAASEPAMAVFLSGHLPFFGDARFDVNRWDYSNFGSLWVR